jgi:hypothetical protein
MKLIWPLRMRLPCARGRRSVGPYFPHPRLNEAALRQTLRVRLAEHWLPDG